MNQEYISIDTFCLHHHTEITFVDALGETGLIEIIEVDTLRCVAQSELEKLEKFTRLFHELEVNVPGLEVINGLLQRIENMEQQIHNLEDTVRFLK